MEYRRCDTAVRFLRLVEDVLDSGDAGYGGGDVKASTERDVVSSDHLYMGGISSVCIYTG